MQLEVGMILEGKVSGITGFGAFVDLPEGKSGMVHISEISTDYVNDINEHLKIGQVVKVKITNIAENGKIALSIRKAMEPKRTFNRNNHAQSPRTKSTTPYEWTPQRTNEGASFEDLMSRFKQSSDDRMSGLKRDNTPPRRARHNSKPNK